MRRVTIIGTVHKTVGRANVSELHAILETVKPDVIFMEVPPGAFDVRFQIFRQPNLESDAVSQYRKGRMVAIVPVDLPTPDEEFFKNFARLHEKVKAENPRYEQLFALDNDRVSTCGFMYLNSAHNDDLWEEIDKEMERTLGELGDSILDEIYESWVRTNALREDAMLETIRSCCRNEFSEAVFLVGAAHRRKIIEKAHAIAENFGDPIQWSLPRL